MKNAPTLTAPPICQVGNHVMNFDRIQLVTFDIDRDHDHATYINFSGDQSIWLEEEKEKALFARLYSQHAAMKAKTQQLDAGQETLTLQYEEERDLPDASYRLECYLVLTWLGSVVITRLGQRPVNALWQWTTRSHIINESDDDDAVATYVTRVRGQWTRRIERMAVYAALAGEHAA